MLEVLREMDVMRTIKENIMAWRFMGLVVQSNKRKNHLTQIHTNNMEYIVRWVMTAKVIYTDEIPRINY